VYVDVLMCWWVNGLMGWERGDGLGGRCLSLKKEEFCWQGIELLSCRVVSKRSGRERERERGKGCGGGGGGGGAC